MYTITKIKVYYHSCRSPSPACTVVFCTMHERATDSNNLQNKENAYKTYVLINKKIFSLIE